MYKRSCSCGMTVYSVENKTVTIYQINTGSEMKYRFNTVSDAIAYYELIAIPDEMGSDYVLNKTVSNMRSNYIC